MSLGSPPYTESPSMFAARTKYADKGIATKPNAMPRTGIHPSATLSVISVSLRGCLLQTEFQVPLCVQYADRIHAAICQRTVVTTSAFLRSAKGVAQATWRSLILTSRIGDVISCT